MDTRHPARRIQSQHRGRQLGWGGHRDQLRQGGGDQLHHLHVQAQRMRAGQHQQGPLRGQAQREGIHHYQQGRMQWNGEGRRAGRTSRPPTGVGLRRRPGPRRARKRRAGRTPRCPTRGSLRRRPGPRRGRGTRRAAGGASRGRAEAGRRAAAARHPIRRGASAAGGTVRRLTPVRADIPHRRPGHALTPPARRVGRGGRKSHGGAL